MFVCAVAGTVEGWGLSEKKRVRGAEKQNGGLAFERGTSLSPYQGNSTFKEKAKHTHENEVAEKQRKLNISTQPCTQFALTVFIGNT